MLIHPRILCQGKIFRKQTMGEHLTEVRGRWTAPRLTIAYANQYDGRERLFIPFERVDLRLRFNNMLLPAPDAPEGVIHKLIHRPLRCWAMSEGQGRVAKTAIYAIDHGAGKTPTDYDDSESVEVLRRERIIFDLPGYVRECHRVEAALAEATANGKWQFGPGITPAAGHLSTDLGFQAADGSRWFHFFDCGEMIYNACPPAEREMRRNRGGRRSHMFEQSATSATLAGLVPPRRRDRPRTENSGSYSPTVRSGATGLDLSSSGRAELQLSAAPLDVRMDSPLQFDSQGSDSRPPSRMSGEPSLQAVVDAAMPWRAVLANAALAVPSASAVRRPGQPSSAAVFASLPRPTSLYESTNGAPRVMIDPEVEHSAQHHAYAHGVLVMDGRMAWSMGVRRVVRTIYHTYKEQRQLRFELSPAALQTDADEVSSDTQKYVLVVKEATCEMRFAKSSFIIALSHLSGHRPRTTAVLARACWITC